MKSTQDTPKFPDVHVMQNRLKHMDFQLKKLRVILNEIQKKVRHKTKMEIDLADVLIPLD